jgi:hypothetical protein
MTPLSRPLGHPLCRTSRALCCGLAVAMTIVLSGCGGSGGTDSSSSAASGVGNSSSSTSVSSSSSSAAPIVGIETPSAISVVTATNAT